MSLSCKTLINLNDLKLRLSYGITGSDAITAYRTQSTLIRIPNSFGENPGTWLYLQRYHRQS